MKYLFYLNMFFFLMPLGLKAQKPVSINDKEEQHIFTFDEISILEDTSNRLDFKQVLKSKSLFKKNPKSTPQNYNLRSTYWYKINITSNGKSKNDWILEFFDQTIDQLSVYIPNESGSYSVYVSGDDKRYFDRPFAHKNFEFKISKTLKNQTVYVKIKSDQVADVIIVLRSVGWFVHYALNEYFIFGLFYGMILIFSFYNLVMFLAVRRIQYLYYVLYNLSVGLYEICSDGLAYQYLWPNSPQWNQYAYGVALYFTSIFAVLFAKKLLHVKVKAPFFDRLIILFICVRSLFFLACLLFNHSWFNYKFIEFIPLTISYIAGIVVLRKGYKPARFFVLGYSFLFIGFTIKFLITLGVSWLNFDAFAYYSLSISFILEMFFLSFSIGDNVRILKLKKEKAQKRIIDQYRINEKLKDNLNKELEVKVNERTKEVYEKSALIIQQNKELVGANRLMKQQADEIIRINKLLEQDNTVLQHDVDVVTRARVMSNEVNFEDFSRIYPDKESCYSYLAELKWKNKFQCRKCSSENYFQGHQPHSRRCCNCDYDESVTNGTLFQNSRIPINKGFYLLFLLYTHRGQISSHKLSKILHIRQSTCWTYGNKINKLIDLKVKNGTFNVDSWSSLLLINNK
ncbi:chromosome partitioning protein ParA [Pedobacter sp. SD-b]|uniref:Chromosome partitioning protein ParA n=1 Tax=Pedobacter segetis TaxID=2793069 RepID=A0ABS1BH99_9SPHI|nr:7TM diverse intracellular signaling domain-containing protein [Pedobacter segetis]MBK0382258.1 chromosome partitioning protein ParA [Pedobacter segetis]